MSDTPARHTLILPAVYAAVLIAAIILAAAVTLLLKHQAQPAHNLPHTAAPAAVTTPVQMAPPTAASVLSAPVASVTGDQRFLSSIREQPTFTSYSDSELIKLGQQLCALYGNDAGLPQAAQLMPRLSMTDVAAFTRASEAAYCPSH
jgi:hypothetical protein